MENSEINVTLREPPFLRLYLQLIDLLWVGADISTEKDKKTIARVAIINLTFALEALANNLLDSLRTPKRLNKHFEKLPPIEKIELFYWLNRQEPLPRGRVEYQCLQELISLRNTHVHPKETISDSEGKKSTSVDPYSGKEIAIEFSEKNQAQYPALNLRKNPNAWSFQDSLNVFSKFSTAIDKLLIDDCNFCSAKLRSIMHMTDFNSKVILVRTDMPKYQNWMEDTFHFQSRLLQLLTDTVKVQ